MYDTREKIIDAALSLFARDGYEAVSVSMIAGELGMTKGALYKHFKSKRDIFDSILELMELKDAGYARAHELPEGRPEPDAALCGRVCAESLRAFTLEQFRRWTEEGFSSRFRRLLTLEQYRGSELAALYRQYLSGGPLDYVADLFRAMTGCGESARALALEFYGPVFLLYSVYDGGARREAGALLEEHMDRFFRRLEVTT